MNQKYHVPEGAEPAASQLGVSLDALAATIAARRSAGEESYTHRLLQGDADTLLKKVMEEAGEVALAAKDAQGLVEALERHRKMPGVPQGRMDNLERRLDGVLDHLRYEVADEVYHLLVVLERYGIGPDELAAELNSRMTGDERPAGGVVLSEEHINRGR